MAKRKRKVGSVSKQLIKKSQEAALAAIQIFNTPLITFKSEAFIVLMTVAWTYLLHAYYRKKGIEYRYFEQSGLRRKFKRTRRGGTFRYWELSKCLEVNECPLDKDVKNNLRFLTGIRNEIVHVMTNKVDDLISGRLQECCIKYNKALKELFGDKYGLDKTISLALQLFSFTEEQIDSIKDQQDLPQNVIDFIADFESGLESKNDPAYSYKVIYMRENVNRENQADRAIRFIDEKSAEGKQTQDVLVKTRSRAKLGEKAVVSKIQERGYGLFTASEHRKFWKTRWENKEVRDKKALQFGELHLTVWGWYEETWIPEVLSYCKASGDKFRTTSQD